MKNKLCYVLLCLMFTVLDPYADAQDRPRVKLKHIAGEVAAYDTNVKTMTVRGKKTEVLIILDEKTSVKIRKETKSLADIKVGDLVNVKYIETEGKNLAKLIEISTDTAEKK